VDHLIVSVDVDNVTICQNSMASTKFQHGIEKSQPTSILVGASAGVPYGGEWDPCFKPGPCPCSTPCKWVVALALPGEL
jgi:hypothetical protein